MKFIVIPKRWLYKVCNVIRCTLDKRLTYTTYLHTLCFIKVSNILSKDIVSSNLDIHNNVIDIGYQNRYKQGRCGLT